MTTSSAMDVTTVSVNASVLCRIATNGSNINSLGYSCPTLERENNPENPVNAVSNIFVFILLSLCIYGMIGNVLSFLALERDKTKRDITIYLLKVLAVGDSINLLARIMEATMYIVRHFYGFGGNPVLIFDMFAFVCVDIGQTLATWLVLPVTLERYIFICQPLHAHRLTTMRRTKTLLSILVGSVMVFNIPNLIYFVYASLKCYQYGVASGNRAFELLEDFVNSRFMYIYWHYFKTMVAVAIPLVILVLFNGRLIYSLQVFVKRNTQRVQGAGETMRGERGTAKILVAIVTLLLLCQGPSALVQALYLAGVIGPVSLMQPIGATLLVFNSASNFIIYCAFGKRFRRILIQMLCCKTKYRFLRTNTWTSVTFV